MGFAILRPFNIYGTRMDEKSPYGRVITNFVRSVRAGIPMKVNGDGEQTRSFCHVRDMVGAVLALDRLEGYPDTEINIGNPERVTINHLADMVNVLSGSKVGTVHVDPVRFEPRHRMPDITRARAVLGWEPEVCLEEGLRELLGEKR